MTHGQEAPSHGSAVSQTVWAESEKNDWESDSSSPVFRLGAIMGGLTLILVLVIGCAAWLLTSRSERQMADFLAEKGSSVLKVFESAIRTGMRGGSGLQLQTLFGEMSLNKDIEFLAVTMPDGVILAHSKIDRIGERLRFGDVEADEEKMEELAPGAAEKWRITPVDGQNVFLLYRHFTLGQKDWPKDVPEPVIFLALDAAPFEITNSQNRNYIFMLSLMLLLGGLSCLVALGYAQRAAESRKKQGKAEKEVARLEVEVRRNEKMAAIGTLAAGVAHEIRNPLSSIKGYATYFSQRFPEGSEDREAASVMVSEADRLNRVITDLLGLAKPTDVKLRPARGELVAGHVLRLLRRDAAAKNVRVVFKTAKKTPEIMADMERLSQALLNLCLNAIDAMESGGELLVAVSGGKKGSCIIIKDSGAGIPKDVIPKIFDPYFTTKRTGTGLGLPMVHKIIKGHSGRIDVSSWLAERNAEGRTIKAGGTIFRLWIPAAAEAMDGKAR